MRKKKRKPKLKPNVELDIVHAFHQHMESSLEQYYEAARQSQEEMMRHIMAQYKFNELNPITDARDKKTKQKRSHSSAKRLKVHGDHGLH